MATLNPRVLELVETLIAARLDWLAFELVEGVQAGRQPEESEETLAAARESIRGTTQPEARGEPKAIAVESSPIPPDEQILWAASYVEERLGEAIKQLQVSIDTLDFVVEGTTERPHKAEAVVQPPDTPEPRAVAVLLYLEGERRSGPGDVAGARERFPALRTALAAWVAQSRGQATP